MSRIVCWLVGHRWSECVFRDWVLLSDAEHPPERCLGSCLRCGKRRGVIACLVCDWRRYERE